MKLTRNPVRWLPVAAAVTLFGMLANPQSGTPAQAAPDVSAVCTNGSNFQLVADLGYIFTPDANTMAMWSYADLGTNAGTFQFPGPVLCVNQGQTVTVQLTNNLPEATSIIFPGQDNVTAAGAPSEPQPDGSLTQEAAANGGTILYSFTPTRAGTFIYESGTNPDKQREMGLVGALIVRPTGGLTSQLYADPATSFTPGREFMQILSEADPIYHNAVDAGQNPPISSIVAKYYFVNGRSMPDTLSPNNSPFLPAQPYSGLIHIKEKEVAGIRYVNVGRTNYPFHPHGADTQIVGHDGVQLVDDTSGANLSFGKFLVDVAPGQTVDATYTWSDVEHYSPGTASSPSHLAQAILPPIQQLGIKPDTWYSMSPYLGVKDASILPPGTRQTSECGEYYHMAHSHALEQSTNFGAAFGGMMTLYRIDPVQSEHNYPVAVCP